jgi:hypothetical protein
MAHGPLAAVVLTLAMVLLPAAAVAGSWPQFRGPNASGIPDVDRPLPDKIGPETNVAWKTEIPAGHSSPVVVGSRIFVTASRGDELVTIGLDRDSGRVLWERSAEKARLEEIHQIGSHAQSTPVADDERVVSFFGSCGLFCYDHDGRLLWKRPMGPFKNNYGAASSPILVGDLVVLNQDHDIDSFLIALDRRTGETVWKTDRSEFPRGFCTPVVWRHGGRSQIVVPGALRVCGYDPADGKELWTVRGSARICNMTPVVAGDGTLLVSEWAPGGDETDRIVAEPFGQMLAQYDKDKNKAIERGELPPGQLGSRFDQMDRDRTGTSRPPSTTGRGTSSTRRPTACWRSSPAARAISPAPTSVGATPDSSPTSLRRSLIVTISTWSKAAASSRASRWPAASR